MREGRTKDAAMKTVKWYAYRATMFLGTIAAVIAVWGEGGKRW
jgi:hypothetical protein